MIALLGLVAQLTIVAHAPATAAACEPIEVSVALRVPGRVMPRIIPPSLAPFEILSSSSVPRTWRDSGARGASFAEYRYVVATDQIGPVIIGSFEARVGPTLTGHTEPMRIDMRPARPDAAPTVVARARVDTSLEVNLKSLSVPETVYVGQQANYEVAVFLNQVARDRLKRNPTFFPPEIQSMLAYDIPSQSNATYAKAGSRCFDALVYQRAIFPLQAGRFVIPPAQLVYALPTSSGFFSREESHQLQTDSAVVIAIEPPPSGRPADYQGAVGNLHLTAHADTGGGKVGVPVLFTVRVAGTGNVKLFPRPDLQVPWAGVVRGEERVVIDTSVQRVRGAKEFDWVLTPKIAGELDIPPVRYSYFNPDRHQYEVASTAPTRLSVGAGALAEADTARTDDALGLRLRFRGPIGVPLNQRPLYWVFLAILPIPALGARWRARRGVRFERTAGAHRSRSLSELVRSERAGEPLDAREVRRVYAAALGTRLGLSPERLTRADALRRVLRRSGVSAPVAADAEELMRQLDAAAYAADGSLPGDAVRHASEIVAATDREALTAAELGPRLTALLTVVMCLGAAVGTLTAAPLQDISARFNEAVQAYQTHNYGAAKQGFAAVAAAEPRAADAWANYGTASWSLGDTATAMVGWQRALRLEPLAADMRERVQLTHSLSVGDAGYVLPLSLNLVFGCAAGCWALCWIVVGIRARRASRPWSVLPTATVALSLALGIGGLVLARSLAARRVAIAGVSAPVRVDPTMGSERRTNVIVGEIVRTTDVEGPWTRVALDDGRGGWVESSSLISLDGWGPATR